MEVSVRELRKAPRAETVVYRIEDRSLAAVPGTNQAVYAVFGCPSQGLDTSKVLNLDKTNRTTALPPGAV